MTVPNLFALYVIAVIGTQDQVNQRGDLRFPRDPHLDLVVVDPGTGEKMRAVFERRDDESRRFVVFQRPLGDLAEVWRPVWNAWARNATSLAPVGGS